MKTTTKKPLAKTTAPAVEVPSLADVLATMAYHVAELMEKRPGVTVADLPAVSFCAGIGGWKGTDCPLVVVSGTIAATTGDEPWGVWAKVTLDGVACGNRCGGREYLVKAYAPVIAWVAAYHAVKAAAPELQAVAS